MRKLLALLLIAVAASSRAAIFPVGIFGAPPALQQTFDTLAPGLYNGFPIFGLGFMSKLGGPGQLEVGPPVLFLSPPNGCMGVNTDAVIKINAQMRFFGGWYLGYGASGVTFRFFDAAGVLIGSVFHQLATTWLWIGYVTIPKWSVVEIIGNGSSPGGVAMDNLRTLP